MALGNYKKCLRYSMFAFNIFFWVLGCAISTVGIWVLVDKNDNNFSNNATNSQNFNHLYIGAGIFIAVGVVIIAVGFLGCCGAKNEKKWMLVSFFVFLCIIFVILLGAGIYAIVAKDVVKRLVDKALINGVEGYFNETSQEKQFMDMVQRDFECCGATNGDADYPPDQLSKVEACQKFRKPCNGQLFKFVKKYLDIIAGVAIGVAVILILGMIFSMILCSTIRHAQIY